MGNEYVKEKEELIKIKKYINNVIDLINENQCLKNDKKEMAAKLLEYEIKEYNTKTKEQNIKEYEKEICSCCRYYNGFSECKYLYENDEIMKPIKSENDFFPRHQVCGHFEWD